MFKKRNSESKRGKLSQYGLLDIPDLDDADEPMDMSDDDLDLEAELAAISGEGGRKQKPRKPAPMAAANLDAMIAESLKDVASDDDISGDEDDPELLSELRQLSVNEDEPPAPSPRTFRPAPLIPLSTDSSTISIIQDRILNYSAAEKQAKEKGENSRARRFNRGLKTLNDLLKQAKSGNSINEVEIPPPVSIGQNAPAQPSAIPSAPVLTPEKISPEEPSVVSSPEVPSPTNEEPSPPSEAPIAPVESPAAPSQPSPEESLSPERREGLQFILKRKQEFKAAALSCKHSGDKPMALEYLKVVKQFDIVVDAWRNGEEMDLRELPTPEAIAAAFKSQQKGEETNQQSTDPATSPSRSDPDPVVNVEGGLITASSMDEALRQRLAAFQEQEAKAKETNNAAKARRLGRIVKSYQDAIRLNAAGKPVPVDELATLPGYAPFPTSGSNAPASPSSPPSSASSSQPSPSPSPRPGSSSRYDKQLALLLHKQKQFKDAAIKAKKEGDIEKAKEYLRAAKGFDAVIEAAKGGLVVDLKSLPLAPKAKDNIEHTFDIVSAEDCGPSDVTPTISVDDDDVIERLIHQLTSQLKLCLSNRDHYKAMGNVAETNRFEHLAVAVKQDIDVVKVAKRSGGNPPKFHYESRQFSVVQCNTDLNENDLELTIVRGIAYNVANPKDVDTYVKFEFPYPQEAPVSDRTGLVKDTNSPQYEAVFPLSIQRNQRACQRVFKRHGIKFEVYSRGGWFSKDSLLGTATVKLAPLETNVTIHEAFPLMDGRRPAGGSLEVKLRVRTPLQQQHIEHSIHRWLVIDN